MYASITHTLAIIAQYVLKVFRLLAYCETALCHTLKSSSFMIADTLQEKLRW